MTPEILETLPASERAEMLGVMEQLDDSLQSEVCANDFLEFSKLMWPDMIIGHHHRLMARAFERINKGELDRLIINMPPRHGKSQLASWLLPAWFLGNDPKRKIIVASHTAELATGFGRQTRNLMGTEDYQRIFPGTVLSQDSKAAGRFNTSFGGQYYAAGVGGALAGRGGDLVIIDDPHSEQEAKTGNPKVYEPAADWYFAGPRQRLQPRGAIIVVMTRWHQKDLTGVLLKTQIERQGSDEWEVITLPAILPSGRAMWPEYWPLEELERIRATTPANLWLGPYMQDPVAEEGAIIKREYWRRWEEPRPPRCTFVIQSWDTAYLKTETADYNAFTEWGVFMHPDDTGKLQPNIMLLNAFKRRMEFPQLKQSAFIESRKHPAPDAIVIEAKASGWPLIQEMRRAGIMVTEYTPTRGNDKVARANGIADVFASGRVWAPNTEWADQVIEECAAFPAGDYDDFMDSTTMAIYRFRQGGLVRLPSDEEPKPRKRLVADYYS